MSSLKDLAGLVPGCSFVVADPVSGLSDSGVSGSTLSPVVVRLAGLPAEAIAPLASPSCVALLQDRETLERELGEVRQTMVDAIGNALPGFDAQVRRFLLNVKRSCFNGREIGPHLGRAEWAALQQISPGVAERIADLEDQLRENDCAFTELYESELARERRHLFDLVQDRRFLRGVALGRPGLVEKARSRARSFAASGSLRSPEKWELSLLRFVTRTATKLSANSTLSAYSLGAIETSPCPRGFRLVDAPQREVSLVRLDRPEAEQLQALVMRHPAARERALVAWNDTVEKLEPGRYRCLRERQWRLDPGAQEFSLAGAARVTAALSDALVDASRDALRDGPLRYDKLLALLGAAKRSDLDELIDLGLVILLPPWASHESHLEQRLGQLLRTLPDDPAARRVAATLDELLALEEGFVSAPQPESSVAEMKDALSRLFQAASRLAGHDGPVATRAHFFEDVLLEPDGSVGGTVHIALPAAQDIMRTAGLVARFAGLFNVRHDVLHTLAAWWREHEPGRREAPFLEIARGFAPVWKQFVPFYDTMYEDAYNTFNPLRAEPVERLLEWRKATLGGSRKWLSSAAGTSVLPVRKLAELVESLPLRYAPQLGACVFVQPLDEEGGSWVLNNLQEGTGRYLSRVVPLLEGARQRRFLDHLIARSVVEVEGEEADLLEVKYPFANLVRAHPPQAARVLDVRGLHLDLPPERRVGLGELRVQADLVAETFRLVDTAGRRVLPVNLSTLSDNGHPNLLRLLLAFGPGETRCVLPLTHVEGNEDFRAFSRLTCGPLVLCRRRWTIGIASLRAALEGAGDLAGYEAVHAWRRRLGLPAVGFYGELAGNGSRKSKPQYVDFSSPSQCRLFLFNLRKTGARQITFQEALPPPAGFPRDAAGNRRAFELLIDDLAIRAGVGNSSAVALNEDREISSLGKEQEKYVQGTRDSGSF